MLGTEPEKNVAAGSVQKGPALLGVVVPPLADTLHRGLVARKFPRTDQVARHALARVPVQAREQGRLLRPVVKGQNAGAFQHQIIRLHRMLQPRHFQIPALERSVQIDVRPAVIRVFRLDHLQKSVLGAAVRRQAPRQIRGKLLRKTVDRVFVSRLARPAGLHHRRIVPRKLDFRGDAQPLEPLFQQFWLGVEPRQYGFQLFQRRNHFSPCDPDSAVFGCPLVRIPAPGIRKAPLQRGGQFHPRTQPHGCLVHTGDLRTRLFRRGLPEQRGRGVQRFDGGMGQPPDLGRGG